MKYEKGSFVLVPNRKQLRLRSLGARAVYMEMCSMCDAHGQCFPSRKLLAENILMSENSIDRFIEELVEAGLITKAFRKNANGARTSNLYQLMILPLPVDAPTPSPSVGTPPSPPIVKEVYPVLTQTSATRGELEEVSVYEEDFRVKKPAKYPNAREVFSWFPNPQPSWTINTTELKHAELLYSRGETAVRGILKFVAKHKDDEFFPKVVKPSDLERKWEDIAAFKV